MASNKQVQQCGKIQEKHFKKSIVLPHNRSKQPNNKIKKETHLK